MYRREFFNLLAVLLFSINNQISLFASHPTAIDKTNTDALTIDTSQQVGGIGTAVPQDILHIYDPISGPLIWEYDNLDGTVRTVVPNGYVLYRTIVEYVIRSSAPAIVAGSTQIDPGASIGIAVGADTVTVAVSANGAVTTSRTAGSNTHKVIYRLMWL